MAKGVVIAHDGVVIPGTETEQLMLQWAFGKLPATPQNFDELVSVRDIMLAFYQATGNNTLNEGEVQTFLLLHDYKPYPGHAGVFMVRNG